MSNARCCKRQLAVLAIASSLPSGCAKVGFDKLESVLCPPVADYSREAQARAAEEVALPPEGSAIAEMLADYAVMRDQARSCQ